MESSLASTIEKIKLQEQGNETKLKEKRTIEATLATVNRNVRDAITRVAKLKDDIREITANADKVDAELFRAKMRRAAIAAQLESSTKELQQLQEQSDQGVSKVWKLRNSLCSDVKTVSDQCDVWALFTKPKLLESYIPKKNSNDNIKQVIQQDGLLENVLKKRSNLLTERDRLMNEPESGEEFLRIKNAIHYSAEMVTQYASSL